MAQNCQQCGHAEFENYRQTTERTESGDALTITHYRCERCLRAGSTARGVVQGVDIDQKRGAIFNGDLA